MIFASLTQHPALAVVWCLCQGREGLLISTAIYCYLLTVTDAAVAGAVAGADPAPSLALVLQLARVPAILGALTQLPWE